MYIEKIIIIIGLILCYNPIIAQNIHEQELIKGIQAITQGNFEQGIQLIENNINNPSVDKEGKIAGMISLQSAYLHTNNKSFDLEKLKIAIDDYDKKDILSATICGIISQRDKDNNETIKYGEKSANIFLTIGDSVNYIKVLPFISSVYFRMGNIDKAIELETIRKEYIVHNYGKENEDYIHSLHNLGAYYSHKGERMKALDFAKEELELKPYDSNAIINLAKSYINLGLQKNAIELLSTINHSDTQYANALYYISHCYRGLEEWENVPNYANKAIKEYQKRINDLSNIEKHNLASAYISMKEYNLAAVILESLLDETNRENEKIDILRDLYFIHEYQKKYDEAIKYGNKTLMLSYNMYGECSLESQVILARLIYCYFESNNDKEAISALKLYLRRREMFLSENLNIPQEFQNALWLLSQTHFDYLYAICTSRWYPNELVEFCYNNNLFMKGTLLSYNLANKFNSKYEYYLLQTKWKDIQKEMSDNDIAIEFIKYPAIDGDKLIDCYAALLLKKNWAYPKMTIIFYLDKGDKVTNETLDKYPFWSVRLNEYLTPGCNIYFSASGGLHNLPIESMAIGDGKIMSDVYNMYRLSSTRELVKKKKEMKYTKAALYGGLTYDMTDDELLLASQTYTKDATTEYFVSRGLLEDSIRGYKWDNLSNTQQEVDYISDLMKKNQITTQTYKGNKGNEESFKALSGHEYNIIHLATHGFFYPDEEAKEKDYFKPMLLNNHYQKYIVVDMSMWRSGLVLSGGNRAWKGDTIPDTVEDGILKAQEIGELDLRGADLVVLSACNTGQGEVTGEGVFGLQRAFKMAGAQTIVMSLTPVDDQTTMAMMNKFYTNLFSGQSKHDAFYNAQRYIRSIKPDPKYWMGWIMLD